MCEFRLRFLLYIYIKLYFCHRLFCCLNVTVSLHFQYQTLIFFLPIICDSSNIHSLSLSKNSLSLSKKMVTMSSLPSPLMCTHSHTRCLRFLSLSLPILQNFRTRPKLFTKSPNPTSLTVRNCGSITAKPSSDIRRTNRTGSEPDEKLRKLRELFVKPGIDIDAYIIPSQDAHQVDRKSVV